MTRYLCAILTFMFIFTTGCSQNKTKVIDLTGGEQVETFDYQESEAISKKLEVEKFIISTPDDSGVGTFCVYDEMVYYAVGFYSHLENPTGMSPIEFEDKYNTQIRSYNIESKEDTLLYKYEEEECVNVTDLQCNGTELVWEEYPKNSVWNIRKLSLDGDTVDEIPEIISCYGAEEKMWSVILTITKDSLYWYNQILETDNPISLYKYDFKTKKTSVEKTGLSLESPYEHVSIIDGICTTYEKEEDNSTTIHVYDIAKKEETDLHVTTDIRSPISNGEICVWMTGGNLWDRSKIFVYDMSKKVLEQIAVSEAFSYGIVENRVLVNHSNNLYCYDVKNKEYEKLTNTENISYLYTFRGLSENIYAETSEDTTNLVMVNVKAK